MSKQQPRPAAAGDEIPGSFCLGALLRELPAAQRGTPAFYRSLKVSLCQPACADQQLP